MDILFIIAMYLAITNAMSYHGGWKEKETAGSFIGGCILSAMFLGVTRIPIYLFLYEWRFPFNPSATVSLLTGVGAIAFWWTMIRWQVPARLLGRKTTPPTQ